MQNSQLKTYNLREPLIIINLLLLQMGESSDVKSFWIPAFAGMTFLEVALIDWRARLYYNRSRKIL